MEFDEYKSIKSHTQQSYVDHCRAVFGDSLVVATEKVHGANFSWIVTQGDIRVANRNGILDPQTHFFGWQRFYSRYVGSVSALFDYVSRVFDKCNGGQVKKIQLFGEIFGGERDGERADGATSVQGGTNYHPDNEFVAFDLAVTLMNREMHYIPYSDLKHMLEAICSPIKIVPVVAIGTFDEVMAFNSNFHSQIPELFGLSDNEIKTDKDYAEGLVIRGYDKDFSTDNNGSRPMLKVKSDKYLERKYRKIEVEERPLQPDAQEMLEQVCSFITQSRVQAVLSKNAYTEKMFAVVYKDYMDDVQRDFEEEYGFKAHLHHLWPEFHKIARREAIEMIRSVWVTLEF